MDDAEPVLDVVVFGATGSIGRAIVGELVARGHRVTGVTRTGAGTDRLPDGLELRTGDVTDPQDVAHWARGHDAVISAIGPRFGSDQSQPFVPAARGLVEGVRLAGLRRLLVVGGAGGLEVAPGVQAVDTPEFPEAHKPNALAQREALEFYRTVDDL
ncbi:MAG TPA: NAD(P)H-binding protein, partial [Acidimicrobiales bacterium]|nr:NAD(P)H-binding protein [Acidimicrobiales bacterium]